MGAKEENKVDQLSESGQTLLLERLLDTLLVLISGVILLKRRSQSMM